MIELTDQFVLDYQRLEAERRELMQRVEQLRRERDTSQAEARRHESGLIERLERENRQLRSDKEKFAADARLWRKRHEDQVEDFCSDESAAIRAELEHCRIELAAARSRLGEVGREDSDSRGGI